MAGGGLLLAVAIGSLFMSDDDRGGNSVSAAGPRVVRIQDDAHAYDLDDDGTLDFLRVGSTITPIGGERDTSTRNALIGSGTGIVVATIGGLFSMAAGRRGGPAPPDRADIDLTAERPVVINVAGPVELHTPSSVE
jgi:hypothetical protein